MGWLAKKFAQASGEALATPIDAIGNVFDKIFTSDEERLQAANVLEKLKQRPAELQVEINKLEAQSKNWFTSGWRPYIGWIAGTSLGIYFIPQFSVATYIWAELCLKSNTIVPYPVSAEGLLELVIAMLGMGAIRTVEKIAKVTK